MDVFDTLLQNLAGKVPLSLSYMTKEEAHRQLVLLAGEDYGYDYDAWLSKKEEVMARIPQLSDENRRHKETDLRKRLREQKKAKNE